MEQTYARAWSLCGQVGETLQISSPRYEAYGSPIRAGGALRTAQELGDTVHPASAARGRYHHLPGGPRRHRGILFLLGSCRPPGEHLEQGITLIDPFQLVLCAPPWRGAWGAVPGRGGPHAVVPGLSGGGCAAQSGGARPAQALAHPFSLAVAQHWGGPTRITTNATSRRCRRWPTLC